ncbi:hypothetical protein GCM10022280_11200 [Sphingomonas swuensis]|uniref:DUF306 domain-containing protein n=1 Tax=Sphingomonas swuensis TaxID=977800 RepID=A0ABP7SQC1_9SPHN
MKRLAFLLPLAALAACTTVPPQPAPPPPAESGSSYRALGTEPFWNLKLDGREMVFTNVDGQRVAEPQPRAIHGFAGDIYQGRRINLNIVHGQRCSDGMSDRVFPDRVQVSVDGRRYEGCGGEPREVATLTGDWTVLAVAGRPASGGQYRMGFSGDRLTAQFGCNRMSGPYRVEGERLVPGAIVATRMACPDMSAENAAGRILGQPMRMAWSASGALTLANEAGEIRLGKLR